MSNPYSRRNVLKLLGIGAGAALGGALSGCAPSAPAPEDAGGLTDDGVKEFSLTSWAYNEAVTKAPLQALIDRYSSANSGVKISTPSYPFNDYLNQLLLQVQGGQLNGVVQLDVAWLATLAATGKLVNLKDQTAGADYTPSALALGQSDGKQFGLPWTQAGIGLISNNEILSRAGVNTPITTITEFDTALRAVKDLGGGIVPWAAMTKVDNLKDIIPWMWTFGSPVAENGTIKVADDASIEALTWYKKLYDDKLIAADVNRVDARALMSQGKCAFYEDAIGGRAAVLKSSPDAALGDKLVPIARPVKATGDKPRHLAWGQVLAVINASGASAAAKFAKTITSDTSYSLEWFTKAGLPPTTKAGLAAPEVQSAKFAVDFSSRIGANSTAGPFWIYPKYAQMESVLAKQVQAILIGQASPKEALTKAQEQITELTK